MVFEFAIRKEILKSGKVRYTPVVRRKRRFFQESWNRIVNLYGKYVLLELDFDPELTHEQCAEHLINYQRQLKEEQGHLVDIIEYDQLEEQ